MWGPFTLGILPHQISRYNNIKVSKVIISVYQSEHPKLHFSLSCLPKAEVNHVELVGTIDKLLYTLPSGTRSIIVRTVETKNRQWVQNIIESSRKYFVLIENFLQNYSYYHLVSTRTNSDLSVGQRVHLVGNLSSQNFWTETKKLCQKVIVKAKQLNEDTSSQDRNIVKLGAQIISNIDNTADCSCFTLATHHIPK